MRKSTCLFPGLALHENRLPINTDLIWRDQHVVRRTIGQRHTVVEAQQLGRMSHTSHPQRFAIGPIFNNDCQIHNLIAKISGHILQCLIYKAFEI